MSSNQATNGLSIATKLPMLLGGCSTRLNMYNGRDSFTGMASNLKPVWIKCSNSTKRTGRCRARYLNWCPHLADSWTAYFEALKAYELEPSKFTGRPKPPGYADGRNLVKFNIQAIGKREFKKGYIMPSMSPIKLPVKPGLKHENLCEVRIVPRVGCFVIEVVCEEDAADVDIPKTQLACAIDIGLDNLATIVFSDG